MGTGDQGVVAPTSAGLAELRGGREGPGAPTGPCIAGDPGGPGWLSEEEPDGARQDEAPHERQGDHDDGDHGRLPPHAEREPELEVMWSTTSSLGPRAGHLPALEMNLRSGGTAANGDDSPLRGAGLPLPWLISRPSGGFT